MKKFHGTYEFLVRINGTSPAFTPSGRQRAGQAKVCTSVSAFVIGNGQVVSHVLLDAGPGVPEAILREDWFPASIPDWCLLSHAHGDHWLGIDELVAACSRPWTRVNVQASKRLRMACLPDTFAATVESRMSYLLPKIDFTPMMPNEPLVLWNGLYGASLTVRFVEVRHFLRSSVAVFEFRDERGGETRVVGLFDIDGFYPEGTPQFLAGSRPDNPLLFGAELMIAACNTYCDPMSTVGRSTGHIHFERLANLLAEWTPGDVRLVHYSGHEDMFRPGDDLTSPQEYWNAVSQGRRIHPSQGPAADWELEDAVQRNLATLHYPDPRSVRIGRAGEVVVISPRVSVRSELLASVDGNPGGCISVRGGVDREVAHRHGVPHATVLLIPAVPSSSPPHERQLLFHRRSMSKRTSPGCLDFAGGHCVLSGRMLDPDNWNSIADIEAFLLASALREANEEIQVESRCFFEATDLARLGELGQFTIGLGISNAPNVERSTVYVVTLPTAAVTIRDTETPRLETIVMSLDEAMEKFLTEPDSFADGAGRVLKLLCAGRDRADLSLEHQLRSMLQS